jgi:signal transduction histidine kinase
MDQAVDKSEVDLHAGLDNTLLILKHNLKAKNIKVVKEYSDQIGAICAYGSELNQVWTNLIDNALYALPEGGEITIKTYPDEKDPGMITVEISDNGPGIPQELQTKIFDPFFTTKAVGQGTGLGLEIVQRIVVNQHKGAINLDSKPGETTFKVCLPVNS